ncbi:FAD dependent oxidoreductase-domain-containing protein [Phyllosticta citribraziliensis]|uniref:FAD dependent oxidoreductase-domain-containing protein n=1 Tax=Phyllosticta citribraziliensis TaxID=989973 RepID=A0ABR1LX86_9PEZI
MDFVLTPVFNFLKTIWTGIREFVRLNSGYIEILVRASQKPGLPVLSPTRPYWLENPPFPNLVNIRSDRFPPEADIVVIGSGITGVAVARTLLLEAERKKETKRVVVLEARQICSGATGRNGGHIKAPTYDGLALLRRRFSVQRASELVRFQAKHLEVLTRLCQQEKIDVAECREVETVDLFLDEDMFGKAQKQVEDCRHIVPEIPFKIWREEKAKENFHVGDHVCGAISYKAGALWPYRFVTSIWNDLTTRFPTSLSIETNTPVESIDVDKANANPFRVLTPRGELRCRHVVHANNAFASHLIPGLKSKMTGLRAHMSAQRPGTEFEDCEGNRSWSIIYNNGFDYMTQRPSSEAGPGDLMIGGGFFRSPKAGLDQFGIWDDRKLEPMTSTHLNGILPTVFGAHWGPDAREARLKQIWSGIICYTADILPYVGKLDPRLTSRKTKQKDAAEWISAGYHGDGMVQAWLCGTALGLMMSDSENEVLEERPGIPGGLLAEWFPPEMRITYKRIKRANLADIADEI